MTARDAPYVLSLLVAWLMVVQAVLGLVFPDAYRDVEWIRATWFGNDGITLLVAVPLLLAALTAARRASDRGTLLWLGLLGYAGYNYAFYLFGAALNAFFPIYAALVVLTVAALALALARLDVKRLSPAATGRPIRTVAGYLVVVGGLAGVWLTTWAGYAFAGTPTPVEPEAFKVIAALDLTVMCTALVVGGMLLWRRRPRGLVVATLASVQGTLYLLVLTVNSIVAVARGLAPAPGQLPLWGPLTLATAAAAAALLLARTADGPGGPRRVRGAAPARIRCEPPRRRARTTLTSSGPRGRRDRKYRVRGVTTDALMTESSTWSAARRGAAAAQAGHAVDDSTYRRRLQPTRRLPLVGPVAPLRSGR